MLKTCFHEQENERPLVEIMETFPKHPHETNSSYYTIDINSTSFQKSPPPPPLGYFAYYI